MNTPHSLGFDSASAAFDSRPELSAHPDGPPWILVVEADAGARELFARVFEADDCCRVAQAGSAAEAAIQLEQCRPRILLLDLHLPDASGETLVRRILQLAPDVALIVMTAFAEIGEAVKMLRLGARDYIPKDASVPEDALAVVRRTLAELKTEEDLSFVEGALREQMARQAAIAEFGIRALSLTDIRELFEEATRLVSEIVGVEFTKIQEVLPDGKHLRLCSGVGWKEGEIGSNLVSAGPETPAGLALRSRHPVIVQNLRQDPRFTPPALLKEHGILSGVTVLIHGPDGPFGVLGMHSARAREFSQIDVDFLQAIANTLAAALGRMEAEERLRRKESFCSTMTETIGALIVVGDREGRIKSFNRACQQLTGYTFDEVVGRKVLNLFIPEDERAAIRRLERKWHSGETHSQFENHWLTKDGDRRLIAWANSVVVNEAGEFEAVIATGIDITERTRLEGELVEATDQERQRLGRDLHDDLCQYLAGIGMLVRSLGRSLGGRGLAEYQAEAEEIGSELKEALAHARLLAHGLSPVDSETGDMTAAFEELALYVERVYQVACRCSFPEGAKVGGSERAMHLFRIAQEAVQNAIRHGQAKEIEIAAIRQADGVFVLTIVDNGRGFSSRSGGTGIRNMTQRAHLMGGRLDVSSTPGKGTLVTCSVPLSGR